MGDKGQFGRSRVSQAGAPSPAVIPCQTVENATPLPVFLPTLSLLEQQMTKKRCSELIPVPCRLYPRLQKPRLMCPTPDQMGDVCSNGIPWKFPLWSERDQGLSAMQNQQCQGNCKGSFSPQMLKCLTGRKALARDLHNLLPGYTIPIKNSSNKN